MVFRTAAVAPAGKRCVMNSVIRSLVVLAAVGRASCAHAELNAIGHAATQWTLTSPKTTGAPPPMQQVRSEP